MELLRDEGPRTQRGFKKICWDLPARVHSSDWREGFPWLGRSAGTGVCGRCRGRGRKQHMTAIGAVREGIGQLGGACLQRLIVYHWMRRARGGKDSPEETGRGLAEGFGGAAGLAGGAEAIFDVQAIATVVVLTEGAAQVVDGLAGSGSGGCAGAGDDALAVGV